MKPADVSVVADLCGDAPGGLGHDLPLAQCVAITVRRYLDDLGDTAPGNNLYQLLLEQIEKPLLAVVLEKARGNRCRAAEMLGINRNTLRKKLQQYGL
jgi:Fis family transcriptional regulator